jgi:hypothetical protein
VSKASVSTFGLNIGHLRKRLTQPKGESVIAAKVIRMLTRRENDWLMFLGIAVSIVSFVYAAVVLWELFKGKLS